MQFTLIANLWVLLMVLMDLSHQTQAQSQYYGNHFPFRHIKNRNGGYLGGNSGRFPRWNNDYGGYYPRKYEDNYYNSYGDQSVFRHYEDDYLDNSSRRYNDPKEGRYNNRRNGRRSPYNNFRQQEYVFDRRADANIGVRHHGYF